MMHDVLGCTKRHDDLRIEDSDCIMSSQISMSDDRTPDVICEHLFETSTSFGQVMCWWYLAACQILLVAVFWHTSHCIMSKGSSNEHVFSSFFACLFGERFGKLKMIWPQHARTTISSHTSTSMMWSHS